MTPLRNIPAIRKLAEEQAREQLAAERAFVARETSYAYVVSKEDEWVRVEARLDLLCDLTRPASRDAVARLVGNNLGWPVSVTAPSFYWTPAERGSCDADGAPIGDDWPAGWWLHDADGNIRFFTDADWCPGDFTMIAGIPHGSEHDAEALTLIATHVLTEPA